MTTLLPPPFDTYSNLREADRDKAIEQALCGGALSPHLLDFVPVVVRQQGLSATLYVSPDYIGATSQGVHFRTPLPAVSLQRIADVYGAVLPTARMVYGIYCAPNAIKVPFTGHSPQSGETRNSNRLWALSNNDIETKLDGRTGLIVGHKKDVVVGPTQMARPDKVAIFGAWGSDGKLIQDLNVTSHYLGYVDYSQCGRLVHPVVTIDGVDWAMGDVFRHPTYRVLLTGERGKLTDIPRYPA